MSVRLLPVSECRIPTRIIYNLKRHVLGIPCVTEGALILEPDTVALVAIGCSLHIPITDFLEPALYVFHYCIKPIAVGSAPAFIDEGSVSEHLVTIEGVANNSTISSSV